MSKIQLGVLESVLNHFFGNISFCWIITIISWKLIYSLVLWPNHWGFLFKTVFLLNFDFKRFYTKNTHIIRLYQSNFVLKKITVGNAFWHECKKKVIKYWMTFLLCQRPCFLIHHWSLYDIIMMYQCAEYSQQSHEN